VSIKKSNPSDWACGHSDIFNGVRINCSAQPGQPCKFVDALGNQRSSYILFHSERQDAAREMIILDGYEPSEKEFMKALNQQNII